MSMVLASGSLYNAIVGGYFVLIGLVMIVFRKQVLEFYYETAGRFPWGWHKVFGSETLLVIITVFGVLSVIGGTTVVVLAIF
jgi:hypothetical protein